MKTASAFILSTALSCYASAFAAETSQEAIARGDALDAQIATRAALAAYLEAEKLGANDADTLRKIAREYSLSMTDAAAKDEKKALGEKSIECAQRALTANPKDAKTHLALAICYGRTAPLMDNKTKIAYSKLVKEHVEKSISLEPSDDYAYHILGVWHYELANLNPVLSAIAKVIYGALPAASNKEAVKNLKKAVELAPRRVSHHVELGRAYAALGQTDLARSELSLGLNLPNREKDDAELKNLARSVLKKL